MKSDQENMYSFIAMNGRDYATKEEMEEVNARILAAQKLAAVPLQPVAEARIPLILDPEQADYEEMMKQGYPAARQVPPVVEHPHRR